MNLLLWVEEIGRTQKHGDRHRLQEAAELLKYLLEDPGEPELDRFGRPKRLDVQGVQRLFGPVETGTAVAVNDLEHVAELHQSMKLFAAFHHFIQRIVLNIEQEHVPHKRRVFDWNVQQLPLENQL